MPLIQVTNLHKEFRVYKHHRGARGAIRNLFTREYRIVRAVDGVTFAIEAGELVGYLGPNGAGKSTTIKMLTGILVPTHGEVIVDGRVPWKQSVDHARGIGVVFGQRTNLWWDLKLHPRPHAKLFRLAINVLGCGEVFDGQPDRLEQRDLAAGCPARFRADQHFADLGFDVLRPDPALPRRPPVIAGFVERRLAPVDEQAGRGHRRRVDLARCRGARPNGIDVRARRYPLALQHRLGGRRRRDDDVRAFDGPLDAVHRVDRRQHVESHLGGEGARALEITARDAHALDGADGGHRGEVPARLHAGADDRQVGRVLARQHIRRDGRHRGR